MPATVSIQHPLLFKALGIRGLLPGHVVTGTLTCLPLTSLSYLSLLPSVVILVAVGLIAAEVFNEVPDRVTVYRGVASFESALRACHGLAESKRHSAELQEDTPTYLDPGPYLPSRSRPSALV